MKGGDAVLVSLPGDFPPSGCAQFRIAVGPSAESGMKAASQVMVDKVSAEKRERVCQVVGRVDDEVMVRVNRTLALRLGL